jgi:hypothetical protein
MPTNDPEYQMIYNRKWRKGNEKYREQNTAHAQRYRENNREYVKEYMRKYKEMCGVEALRQYWNEWYRKNREHRLQWQRERRRKKKVNIPQ